MHYSTLFAFYLLSEYVLSLYAFWRRLYIVHLAEDFQFPFLISVNILKFNRFLKPLQLVNLKT